MKINDLMDLTLREILENYVVVQNLECGYYYGIFKQEDVDQIYEEYNIDKDYPEAFSPEGLVSDEIIVDYDAPVRDYDTLVRIMENLGVSKK